MPLADCIIELKLKWTKYCALSAKGNANTNKNDNANNIILTIKDPKPCLPVVTLSASENQKLSKLLCKGFERSVHWNEYIAKNEKKNATNEYRHFLESHFVGANRLYNSKVLFNQRNYWQL